MRLSCRVLLALAVCAIPVVAARADQAPRASPATPQAPPVFRTDVRLIDVDVFVTDRDGAFVRGLTADDFEIREDGELHEIRTFSLVDLPIADRRARAEPGTHVEADTVTNRTADGRIYLLLMDGPSTGAPGGAYRRGPVYDEFARRFARQFVDDMLNPGDQMAVVHVQGTLEDSQGFTGSPRLIHASIDRYGRGLSGDPATMTGPEMVARHLASYRAMQEVSERLGAISGRRKAVLWVGGQMRFDLATMECPRSDPRNLCAIPAAAPTILAAYRDAMRAAARHNVAVYPIDPSGLTEAMGTQELDRMAALRMVAEDTGGIAVVGTNNLPGRYRAIVRDTSTYYVLGYSPSREHRDGRFHEIEVRVKRPGVSVRARKGYFAPDRPEAARESRPLPAGVSAAARDALRTPLAVRGLGIEVSTAVFRGTGEDASVVVGGQIAGELRLEPKSQIAVSYQLLTPEGRVHAGEYTVFGLDLQPATRARAEARGLRFVDRLSLPPGRYELRLVADQAGGAIGSVVAHLEVPRFDDDLAMSGVALAVSSAADDATLAGDDTLRAALGVQPTVRRLFARGDAIRAFVETYGNTRGPVDVVAIVTTEAGVEATRAAGRPLENGATRDGARGFTMELDLGGVAPGRYLLTVRASAAGDKPVQRVVPFTVGE